MLKACLPPPMPTRAFGMKAPALNKSTTGSKKGLQPASPLLSMIVAYRENLKDLDALSNLMQSCSHDLIELKKVSANLECISLRAQKQAGSNAGSGSGIPLGAVAKAFPSFFRSVHLNFSKQSPIYSDSENDSERYWFKVSKGIVVGKVFDASIQTENQSVDAIMSLSGALSNNDRAGDAFSKGLQSDSQVSHQQINNLYANLASLCDINLALIRSIWSVTI